MKTVQLKDKTFVPFISHQKIQMRLAELGQQINRDYAGKKPLFVGILNGSFVFAADLVREIELDCEITFIKCRSYEQTQSSGKVIQLIGLEVEKIKNRDVIIVEDIVDTGLTMESILSDIQKMGAKSIAIASLLFKPDALQKDIKIDYLAFEIENRFVVGYGLDYDGHGRQLPDIYVVSE